MVYVAIAAMKHIENNLKSLSLHKIENMDKSRFLEDDFNDFIQSLIDNNNFNDAKEQGIAKLVIDLGYEALSAKQKFVFDQSIEPYIFEECKRCGEQIPWCEMIAAEDNGHVCSWCQQLGRDDNKESFAEYAAR